MNDVFNPAVLGILFAGGFSWFIGLVFGQRNANRPNGLFGWLLLGLFVVICGAIVAGSILYQLILMDQDALGDVSLGDFVRASFGLAMIGMLLGGPVYVLSYFRKTYLVRMEK